MDYSSAENMDRDESGRFIIDEPSMSSIFISAEKNLVKSGGWLATFQAFDRPPKHAAFTTASAAKSWLVEQFNNFANDERKRLPWKKQCDSLFTAHAEMTARGKINFKKD